MFLTLGWATRAWAVSGRPGVDAAPAAVSRDLGANGGGLGRTVVVSLVLLFAGVLFRQWRSSKSRPELGNKGSPSGAASWALDAQTPLSSAVAKVFLRHAPDQVAAVGQALEAGDRAAIKATAHKLKGSCLAIGAPRMAELCASLEAGANDAEAGARYAELRQALMEIERELTAQLVDAESGAG
jgi:HPt (histidine-containing phosphotransfer) domain-containing protein